MLNRIYLLSLVGLCILTGAAGTMFGFYQLLSWWGVPFATIIIVTPLILSRQIKSWWKDSGIFFLCLICTAVGVMGNYMTLQRTFLGNQEAVHAARAKVNELRNKTELLREQRQELTASIKLWNDDIKLELADGGEGPTARGLIKQRDKAEDELSAFDESILQVQQEFSAAQSAVLNIKRESSSLQAWLDLHVDPQHHQNVLTGLFFGLALLLEPIGLIALQCLRSTSAKPLQQLAKNQPNSNKVEPLREFPSPPSSAGTPSSKRPTFPQKVEHEEGSMAFKTSSFDSAKPDSEFTTETHLEITDENEIKVKEVRQQTSQEPSAKPVLEAEGSTPKSRYSHSKENSKRGPKREAKLLDAFESQTEGDIIRMF